MITCKALLISFGVVQVPLGDIWSPQADLPNLSSGYWLVVAVQDGDLHGALRNAHCPRLVRAVLWQGIGRHLVRGFRHCIGLEYTPT